MALFRLKKKITLLFIFTSLFGARFAYPQSDTKSYSLGAFARVRAEGRGNTDHNREINDNAGFIGSRFQVDFTFRPTSTSRLFLQPQFGRTWGLKDTGGSQTSGALDDPNLEIHQAYVHYATATDRPVLALDVGRQELIYGDELVLGAVGWSNTGRSFDAIRTRSHVGSTGWVDLIGGKLVESSSLTTSIGADDDLFGIYSGWDLGPVLKNFDLYVLHQQTAGLSATTGVGTRLKSTLEGGFDYRVEATWETVKNEGSQYQADAELGFSFGGLRGSVEYFRASKGYRQWFPTGHKWLGYADEFSRRNIHGVRAGFNAGLIESLTLAADVHAFYRVDTGTAAFNANGSALGTVDNDSAIGQEFDVVATYTVDAHWSLQAGSSVILPGAYLKANRGDDLGTFYYLQTVTKF